MRRMRVLPAVLAPLALAACGSAAASGPRAVTHAPGAASGINGRVVSGPTCPVERIPPDPRCAPRPLTATVRIAGHAASGRSTNVVVRTGAGGRFHVALAPGTYVLTPLSPHGRAGLPRPPAPLRVQVRPGRFTAVTIAYDSGIR